MWYREIIGGNKCPIVDTWWQTETGAIMISPLPGITETIIKDKPMLDLDYIEDSSAEADANFVLTDEGKIIEIQTTAEDSPFSEDHFLAMMTLAKKGVQEIIGLQKKALGI